MKFDAQDWMQAALAQAKRAAAEDEVPVGAVIIDADGTIIAEAHNQTESGQNACNHAEMLAIEAACKARKSKQLQDHILVVTLEPCAMCAGAIAHARISTLIIGAEDPKSGAVHHGAAVFSHAQTHHTPEIISGILADECSALLSEYFQKKR